MSNGNLVAERYAPVQQVGEGGFGSVFLAVDVQTSANVALKFLTKSSAVERFRREARMLQEYAHPHVVEILDANLDHVPPFIVMEYCAFGSLRSWVSNRRSWRDVTVAVSQAAMGLTASSLGSQEITGPMRDRYGRATESIDATQKFAETLHAAPRQ